MVSNSIDVYERVRLKVVTYRGVCLIIAAFKSLISFSKMLIKIIFFST